MKRAFRRFARSEDRNAAIDWVVLMAGLVLMAISVVITVTDKVDNLTDATVGRVESMQDFSPS